MNRHVRSVHVLCALFLFVIWLFWSDFITATADHPGDSVSYYIDSYGEVLPATDTEVARAYRVFERVRAVADKNTKRLPKLVVVDGKVDPWAIALPDGHIVLSRKAITICHRQASTGEAEARLAFVLGHELAHLAHDDFWHREVYAFIANTPGAENIEQLLRKVRSRTIGKELAADDAGFIYAALAGYPVDLLIRTIEDKPQFFEYWTRQTHRRANGKHPTIKKRAELLRRRLDDLRDKIVLFDYGVRLSHFDYCDDAIYFLRAFQKTFPGREVLNNLGYCYLQMARQAMEPKRAYFYWMPLLMDGETRAQFLIHRGGSSIKMLRQAASGTAQGFLREAADYLQRAVRADPGYLPAKINLAVAYLYLGRPHSARSVLTDARETSPGDATVEILDALALYEQTEAGLDLWPAAVAKLEKVVAEPAAPESALFNLARLLAVRPRPAEAQSYWNQLAVFAEKLPDSIRFVVCRQQSDRQLHSCNRHVRSNPPSSVAWPLPQNSVQRLSQKIREEHLGGWKTIGFDWFKDKLHGHIYQRPDGRAEILELDNFVQMQVLKGGGLGPTRRLLGYCGKPLRERALSHGKLLSCTDWAAWVDGDRVKEIWTIMN